MAKQANATPANSNLDAIYQDVAHQFGDDWRLAKAFAMKESSENPAAENPNDPSYGLYGIQPFWLVSFGVLAKDDPELQTKTKDLLTSDPRFATEMFFRILAYFRRRTNPLTLSAFKFPDEADIYNVGETLWSKGVRNIAYKDFIVREYAELSQVVDA